MLPLPLSSEKKPSSFSIPSIVRNVVHSIKQWEKRDLARAVPVVVWLLLFFLSAQIPNSIRPEIQVSLLPTWERSIFGTTFVFDLFPSSPLLTLITCPPYLFHFAIPWIFALYLWKVEGKGMGFLFLYALGILNCAALTIQLVLPTAPPWYLLKYGDTPAYYGIPSDPGRLVQIDDLFGVTLFRGMYGTNPVVFGSFPSLHGAWPLLIALFSSDKVLGPWKWLYVAWVWWAAVYLTHHYIVDLLGGALLVFMVLYLVKGSLDEEQGKVSRHRLVLCV